MPNQYCIVLIIWRYRRRERHASEEGDGKPATNLYFTVLI